MTPFGPPNSYNSDLQQFVNFDLDEEQLKIQLQQHYFNIAYKVNGKDSGSYETIEQLNNQQFFTPGDATKKRYVYRTVVNFGALPNATTKNVAHGLTFNASTIFTRLYATATNPTTVNFLPIPYVDPNTAANGILLRVTGTNVTITTAANYSAFTTCYVVLEYIKG